uniref:DUF1279 domain-containing protein n=1 Tax=Lotharella oceanica TaxID=641309 RepID=A0A7S2TPT1_9EUKA|mmetsp:Transcript_22309/g.41890  ORF Transcript_22309/g.41890 Transcript_22309/m.41890 type:complete len:217 (+) Transcript_22309:2-652(+)
MRAVARRLIGPRAPRQRWPSAAAPIRMAAPLWRRRSLFVPATSARSPAWQPIAGARLRMLSTGTKQVEPDNKQKEEEEKHSSSDHLRLLWRRYGWIGIGTYATIDVVTLGAFYVLVDNGVDVKALLDKIHLLELMEKCGMEPAVLDSKTSTLFTAWVLYTAVAPVRFALTFALTPLISRYLRIKQEKKDRLACGAAEKEQEEQQASSSSGAQKSGQ